jgi:hypothetical protein
MGKMSLAKLIPAAVGVGSNVGVPVEGIVAVGAAVSVGAEVGVNVAVEGTAVGSAGCPLQAEPIPATSSIVIPIFDNLILFS